MANIVPKIEIQDLIFKTSDQELKREILGFVHSWNDSSPSFVVKTSGSTGIPKSIQLQKKYAVESAKRTGNFFSYQAGEQLALCISIQTIGAKMMLIRAACFQMKVQIYDVSRNPFETLSEAIKQVSLVPLQLAQLISESPEKLSYFESILLGGAPVDDSLRKQIEDLHLNVYEGFGMTECYSHIALRQVAGEDQRFRALTGIRFSNLDEQLCIDAPHLGLEKLVTNDLVEVHSETSFSWIGRADFVINSGGYKFFPEKIERKIGDLLTVPYFIFGQKNAEFGEIICLALESSPEVTPENAIRSLLEQVLTSYERPKRIYFISTFERSSSGKIRRTETKKHIFESES